MLIDQLFKNYPEGFVVYLPKESGITNKQRIARYVARYIRHPAVANTRLYPKGAFLRYVNYNSTFAQH